MGKTNGKTNGKDEIPMLKIVTLTEQGQRDASKLATLNLMVSQGLGMDVYDFIKAVPPPYCYHVLGFLWTSFQKNDTTIPGTHDELMQAELSEREDGEKDTYDGVPDFEEAIRRAVAAGVLIPEGERFRWKGAGDSDHWDF